MLHNVETGNYDNKASIDGDMRRPAIFFRWTLLHSYANANHSNDKTYRDRPVVGLNAMGEYF